MKDADAVLDISPRGRVAWSMSLRPRSFLGIAAVAAALVLAVTLAVRPIAGYDVGYHLAYGEHFLDTHEIVQTNRFVYTRLRPEILADPDNLGPGCRYDAATDTYHFVNANWLSQVVMATAWRAGGAAGLGILQAALIAAIFLTIVSTMRRATWHGRLGHVSCTHGQDARATVGWHWIAPAVVLVALAAYERFNIRPEVFGYLMLVMQWRLLVGYDRWHGQAERSEAWPCERRTRMCGTVKPNEVRLDRVSAGPRPSGQGFDDPGPLDRATGQIKTSGELSGSSFSWRRVVGVIVLQVLAVNFHSYFILGIALVGAMFTEVLLRRIWARTVADADTAPTAPALKWLGIATVGVILASLVNPWHVRGAIMPIQTLLFLGRHNITGGAVGPGTGHPWATIGEFFAPFSEEFRPTRATTAYIIVLCLAGVAGLVGILRRRWGWLLVLAGMTVISTRMRRNIAPAAMIIVPLSLIILTDGWNWLGERLRRTKRGNQDENGRADSLAGRACGVVVAAASLLVAAWFIFSVVTNRFYFSQRQPWRCGTGLSPIAVPVGAAEWINTNNPSGEVFCGYDCSSNLMYFTRPHRRVPVLTNTWAYPPYVMEWVLRCTSGSVGFAPAVEKYNIGTVVLRSTSGTAPLIRTLAKSPDWVVVDVSLCHVVFLRRTGANAALANSRGISKKDFDVARHIERVIAADPVPAYALHNTAFLLYRMRWGGHAITVWRECLQRDKTYYEAMGNLGMCLALRGTARMMLMQEYQREGRTGQADNARREGLADWAEAEKLFKDALEIKPDYDDASRNLRLLTDQMSAFRRGVIVVPQMQ